MTAVRFLAKLAVAWAITRDRTLPARRVRSGDLVLDLHGWEQVTAVEAGEGVTLRYAGGACRYANPRAPFRVRRAR
jgi:hypothetical protein